eukprot:GHVL01009138.1.p1 GENE.GHVL01009138.1~~GHVL01009138.1.p1  ORF type:complete len:931 (+),score=90.00 GHVL01009138.1:47-2839(+)
MQFEVQRLWKPIHDLDLVLPRDTQCEVLVLSTVCNEGWGILVSSEKAVVRVAKVILSKKECIFLPAMLLEHLRLTPGKSHVHYQKLHSIATSNLISHSSSLPYATHVSLRHVAGSDDSYINERLKTFWHVPRVCWPSLIIAVPVALPSQFKSIECDSGNEVEEIHPAKTNHEYYVGDVVCPTPINSWTVSQHDPIGGNTFSVDTYSHFRIESIQIDNSQHSTICAGIIDSSICRVELLPSSCQARPIPFGSYHYEPDSINDNKMIFGPPRQILSSLLKSSDTMVSFLSPWLRGVRSIPKDKGTTKSLWPAVLVTGSSGCGKRYVARHALHRLGLHIKEIHSTSISPASFTTSAHHKALSQSGGPLGSYFTDILTSSWPVGLIIRDIPQICATSSTVANTVESAGIQAAAAIHHAKHLTIPYGPDNSCKPVIVIVGMCEDVKDIHPTLRRQFDFEIMVEKPNETTREEVLTLLQNIHRISFKDCDIKKLTRLTQGFTLPHLRSCVRNIWECERKNGSADYNSILKKFKKNKSAAGTMAHMPSISWEDVGGVETAKNELTDCISLPLLHPNLFDGEYGTPLKIRSGVLMFGPPGTGKTLLAKAVASEFGANFISIKGPELLNMYIGESEKNVRMVFQQAIETQPCILFFDEIDSLAPCRGRGSDSGGVMDRLVAQLLTELDAAPARVFVIGATNRPDLLDPALLRPGRFDRRIYLPVPTNRMPILRAITQKMYLAIERGPDKKEDFIKEIDEHLKGNFTGADLKSMCNEALLYAAKDRCSVADLLIDKLKCTHQSLMSLLEIVAASEKKVNPVILSSLASWSPIGFCGIVPREKLEEFAKTSNIDGLRLWTFQTQIEVKWMFTHESIHGFHAVEWDTCLTDFPHESAIKQCGPGGLLHTVVEMRHFQTAIQNLRPSVSDDDLKSYERISKKL